MAKDPSTTAREFALGTDGREFRPSLTDWLVRDLRIASSTDRPAAPAISDGDVGAPVAAAPAEVAEPDAPDDEIERYEPIQVEAIDGGGDVHAEALEAPADAFLTGAAVASSSRGALPPPPVPEASESIGAAEGAGAAEAFEAADVASDVAMSPPEDWLEEDEIGAAGAFFSSSPDFDELDEAAPVTGEGGSSLSPQVFTPDEEDDGESGGPLVVPGIGASASRWKTIAAVAAAVFLVLLFGQRFAKRHAQAASPPLPVATIPSQAKIVEPIPTDTTAEADDTLAMDDAHGGNGSGAGSGRAHAGPADSRSGDPATPGGPSVARFPDLPREILNQLEQVFESESTQRNKGATDSIERYSR